MLECATAIAVGLAVRRKKPRITYYKHATEEASSPYCTSIGGVVNPSLPVFHIWETRGTLFYEL